MGKKSEHSQMYKDIVELNDDIKQLTKEIGILENCINSMAASRADKEAKEGEGSTPLWWTWFDFFRRKNKKTDDWDFLIEENTCISYQHNVIRMSESELQMLLGFKEAERDMLRKDLQEIINELNEDHDKILTETDKIIRSRS